MEKIYNIKPKELLNIFIEDYSSIFNIDKDIALKLINETIRYYNGNPEERDELVFLQDMENQWYDALNKSEIDYSVYDNKYYFTDMWACWSIYSRQYIKNVVKKNNLKNESTLFDLLENPKCIVDLGCGIGMATASLKQIFPKSKVYGTNIKDTKQWEFCNLMSKKYNFNLIEDISKIKSIDLVFASEYFEHIISPIEHLRDILKLNPKMLIIANAFNTRSIGHFYNYIDNDNIIPQDKISKVFNKVLTDSGYEKVKTKFWNNRPAVFIKKI